MIRLVSGYCVYCRRPLVADLDEQSSLAWRTLSGDYGCTSHPLNTPRTGYEHQPQAPEAVALTFAVQRMFNAGVRDAEYIDAARQVAMRLGYNPYQEKAS